jgi:hypothetical protein
MPAQQGQTYDPQQEPAPRGRLVSPGVVSNSSGNSAHPSEDAVPHREEAVARR